jgi:hypothetical protein
MDTIGTTAKAVVFFTVSLNPTATHIIMWWDDYTQWYTFNCHTIWQVPSPYIPKALDDSLASHAACLLALGT